jgi:hypothetical protein
MIIPIDREKKIVLLKALKKGYLDTMDMPELYGKQFNYFLDIMKRATSEDDENDSGTSTPKQI